jgi:hypothetical protein
VTAVEQLLGVIWDRFGLNRAKPEPVICFQLAPPAPPPVPPSWVAERPTVRPEHLREDAPTTKPQWHATEADVLAVLAALTAVVGPLEAARIMDWST